MLLNSVVRITEYLSNVLKFKMSFSITFYVFRGVLSYDLHHQTHRSMKTLILSDFTCISTKYFKDFWGDIHEGHILSRCICLHIFQSSMLATFKINCLWQTKAALENIEGPLFNIVFWMFHILVIGVCPIKNICVKYFSWIKEFWNLFWNKVRKHGRFIKFLVVVLIEFLEWKFLNK